MFVFIILFGLCAHVTFAANAPCLTPNGELSECISIYTCPHYISNIKNRTRDTEQYLKDSFCGIGPPPHHDILVCCGTDVDHQCGLSDSSNRVFGGNETGLFEYPWMALIEYRNSTSKKRASFGCGGSLISNRYILTAAHCVLKTLLGGFEAFSVRLGEHDVRTDIDMRAEEENEPAIDVLIEEIITHKSYMTTNSREADIALIRLTEPVEYTDFIKQICLPSKNYLDIKENDTLYVSGWGITEHNMPMLSPVKMHADVKLWHDTICKFIYQNSSLTNRQMCAGGAKGKDACRGDSGGPLMKILPFSARYSAVGMVSYGPGKCGTDGIPGVYTKLSSFIDWIWDNVKP